MTLKYLRLKNKWFQNGNIRDKCKMTLAIKHLVKCWKYHLGVALMRKIYNCQFRKLIVAIFCLFLSETIVSQDFRTIHGFITDSLNGEAIIDASIIELSARIGTTTNEFGYYSLKIKNTDSIELYFSCMGYTPKKIVVKPTEKYRIDVQLRSGIDIQQVTIEADRISRDIFKNETSIVHYKSTDILKIPDFWGERDPVQYLQLFPGVQTGGEGKSNLYIRGGSPDQNLILLDDVPLYEVTHMGGFFSIFNGDAINDIKLLKGGFPSRYGGRLSSVVDIRMKEGNDSKFRMNGTVGLFSSKISIEGPIIKKKMSYIISARKMLFPIFSMFDNGISYDFYDVNAKVNIKLGTADRIYLSTYLGNDVIKTSEKNEVSSYKNSHNWGNRLVAFRWNHLFNDKIFSNLVLSSTQYHNQQSLDYDYNSAFFNRVTKSNLSTLIHDLGINYDVSVFNTPQSKWRLGTNNTIHLFNPNDEYLFQESDGVIQANETYSRRIHALENAVYVENERQFDKLGANLGIRFCNYHLLDLSAFNHFSFEPRILLSYKVFSNSIVKYSYSRMSQFVHLLAYSGTGTPNDYWMPSSEDVLPEKSFQHTLSYNQDLPGKKYQFSIEAYYKEMENLVTFLPGSSLNGHLDSWEKTVATGGKGYNYGLEVLIEKMQGKLSGWVSATFSKAERQFDQMNFGEPFSFKYDQLLDLAIVLNYTFNEKLFVTSTWQFSSGSPITLPTGHYVQNEDDIFIYSTINGYRMKDFHRLDISVNYQLKARLGISKWSIGIYNLYNRANPYYYYFDRKIIEIIPVQVNGGQNFIAKYDDLKLYQRSLWGIMPMISYSFELN